MSLACRIIFGRDLFLIPSMIIIIAVKGTDAMQQAYEMGKAV